MVDPAVPSLESYLAALEMCARREGFAVAEYGRIGDDPLLVLTRAGEGPALYLSTGMHGDEPAGPLGLLAALDRGLLAREVSWTVYPMLNPAGFRLGTRENAAGNDVNRDYLAPANEESRLHRAHLEAGGQRFRAQFSLHEDWEARAAYLYEHNPDDLPTPRDAILGVLESHCGLEVGPVIDGWDAAGRGLIRPESVPELREFWPEQIYLLERHTRMSYTTETPSALPLGRRVEAQAGVVKAISRFFSAGG